MSHTEFFSNGKTVNDDFSNNKSLKRKDQMANEKLSKWKDYKSIGQNSNLEI
jgi:hypothetical protein